MWSVRSIVLPAILLLFALVPAHAQATRTWVSGVGDDVNPCSRTAPCKTFAGAISKTAAKGEINVLDPGGFGAVTITKSISIIAEGATGGVLVSGTNAIIINAAATDTVMLKGLEINGIGTGLDGIRILSAGNVHISNCLIYGFSSASSSAISVVPTLNPAEVVVSETKITKNRQGVLAGPSGGATAKITLDRVVVENNDGPGVRANASGLIHVSNSVITYNNRGVQQGGNGQIVSSGNNVLTGNSTDGAFSSTVPLQ